MPTRVHLRVLAFLALGGCGGIDIDIPEWETGDVDGGLDLGGDLAGELDDGWSSHPDDGGDDGGHDDDGGDDAEVDDDDGDGGDVETSVADDGSDDGPILGDCCEAHDEPGCDDPGIMACVCAADPFCCQNFWDPICVDEVTDLGCGMCEGADDDVGEVGSSDGDEGSDDDGGNTGPCCEAHDGTGCEYAEVAACVCEADPFCCNVMWDELCVAEVDTLACGVCGSLDEGGTDDGGTTEGDDDGNHDDGGSDDGGGTGACCEPHDTAGCEYPEVEDCVCLSDPFCCDVVWDAICVDEVESLACGICS